MAASRAATTSESVIAQPQNPKLHLRFFGMEGPKTVDRSPETVDGSSQSCRSFPQTVVDEGRVKSQTSWASGGRREFVGKHPPKLKQHLGVSQWFRV